MESFVCIPCVVVSVLDSTGFPSSAITTSSSLFFSFLLVFSCSYFPHRYSHFLTITGRFYCYWIDGRLLRSITRCAAGRNNTTIAQLQPNSSNFLLPVRVDFFFLCPILSNSGSSGVGNKKKTNGGKTLFSQEPLGLPILQTGPPPSRSTKLYLFLSWYSSSFMSSSVWLPISFLSEEKQSKKRDKRKTSQLIRCQTSAWQTAKRRANISFSIALFTASPSPVHPSLSSYFSPIIPIFFFS